MNQHSWAARGGGCYDKNIFLVKICLEDSGLMGICFIKDVSLGVM